MVHVLESDLSYLAFTMHVSVDVKLGRRAGERGGKFLESQVPDNLIKSLRFLYLFVFLLESSNSFLDGKKIVGWVKFLIALFPPACTETYESGFQYVQQQEGEQKCKYFEQVSDFL